jgi:predicted nuclease of predicted toxin-antitoxin system
VSAFLVDESLPRAVTRALLAEGHDVLDARDVGLRGATDDDVFARALHGARILISGDVDFANTLRFPPGSHAGIIVLRLPNSWSPSARALRAVTIIAEALHYLAEGALVIVDAARIRVLRSSTH